jgi:hypothetical protein
MSIPFENLKYFHQIALHNSTLKIMFKRYLLFILLGVFAFPSHGQSSKSQHWYQEPLRILQTVLRQPDAASYDVDSLVDYMKTVHANVLVINGGGIVDFFQNTLPMANVNPYMGKRDLLADIVKGCHENEIKVITRVDFRGVHKERYDLHPDWFAKDENGEPIILNYTKPGLYAPCYNGHYRNDHSVQFIEQLMAKYHVDGIWHNSVNFHNVCYCDPCKELYHQEYQKEIPVKASSHDEWEEYYKWNEKMASNQLAKMRGAVKKYGEDKSYAAEVFDMYAVEQQKHTGINLYSAAKYFDFFVTVSFIANNSENVHYKDIYYPAAIVKFLKSLEPEKSPVILFGGNGTEHRYTYDPPLDSRLWLWEAAAIGGGYWNCYFNGDFPSNTLDRRNAYLATDAYTYIEENLELIDAIQPVTDIAIYYSKASGELLGDHDFSFPMQGILRLLEEEHFQYSFVSDRDLTRDKLDKFKVLIMPNVAALSDAEANTIKEWVKDGGKLMATFQTSLFDENGLERSDFALSDLFGVNYSGQTTNTAIDHYQKIITRTNLLDGFELTELLHNGGNTALVNPKIDAKTITGYLPKINNQPPENAFPDNWDSHNPIMVNNKYGKGEVIYFANETAKLNYTVGHPDYNDLMTNALNSLIGDDKILKTNAPASVHVYLNKSKTEEGVYQLSLVNTSSNSQRPFRELIPVSNIEVELPFEFKSFQLLNKGSNVSISKDGRKLNLATLGEFCGIKIAK